ncbi:LON peptidase substrate-binding domain-containing protein [Gemmata palustris]|uniref:LON peptidase substrate-binding domain-containing protein n=1 Tax=Gemmata palustris TaxID=2822762 RepID=UPI0036F26DBC
MFLCISPAGLHRPFADTSGECALDWLGARTRLYLRRPPHLSAGPSHERRRAPRLHRRRPAVPLPNLVLFPHVVQGLHIFEPRYRQMAADALAGDGLIAMALLRPDQDEPADWPRSNRSCASARLCGPRSSRTGSTTCASAG